VRAASHDASTMAQAEVYVVITHASGRKQLTQNGFGERRAPAWSPDGTRIVYMAKAQRLDHPHGRPRAQPRAAEMHDSDMAVAGEKDNGPVRRNIELMKKWAAEGK